MSVFLTGNPRVGGQTSSKVLKGQELQGQLYLPNVSILYGMIGTTFLCWSWMVRLVLCTLGSLYFSVCGGGLSGGCCGMTSFMNQKILHENAFLGGLNKLCIEDHNQQEPRSLSWFHLEKLKISLWVVPELSLGVFSTRRKKGFAWRLL